MFTRNLRLVIAVMCVPMPPDFLALPERQIMLPFIGRLPVNSQMRAINFSFVKEPQRISANPGVTSSFSGNSACLCRAPNVSSRLNFYGHTKTFCRPAAQTLLRCTNLGTALRRDVVRRGAREGVRQSVELSARQQAGN